MTLILFVCRGNTCRSPLAEALARKRCSDSTLTFASAGMSPAPLGGPASAGALQVSNTHALDLSQHRSRAADAALLATATHILALDKRVYQELRALMPADTRVSLLLTNAPQLGRDEVADPWGGDAAAYARAFADIEAGVSGLLQKLTPDRPTGSA